MVSEQQVAFAKLAAKRQIGMLRTEINYQVSHGKANKEDLEQAYSRLQQEISRARFVLQRLSDCLEESEDTNPDDCTEVVSLQSLLQAAVIERSKLYELVFGNQKKDSLKAFKESIVDMIERGQAPTWISTVTKAELINHGQEINRLFQLLVEGQGTTSGIPLVDSLTLSRASDRVDLFSTKQCESLRIRSNQVDEFMRKEVERLVQNLPEDEDTTEFLLLPGVSERNEMPSASGWICEKCTFLNENHNDRCNACGMQQDHSFLTVARRNAEKPIRKAAPKIANTGERNVVIKKTPARGSSTNTLWIRNQDVPELIGPRGKNQKELIKKTGAISIYAFQERLDQNGMCPVEIEGNREAFEMTVAIVEKKFNSKTVPAANKYIDSSIHDAKETVWIRNMDVPELIGPQGRTVKALKAKTGVKSITAWQERVDKDGMCPIVIRGHPEAVNKAATTIMNMFCGVQDASRPDSAELPSPTSPVSTRLRETAKSAVRPSSTTSVPLKAATSLVIPWSSTGAKQTSTCIPTTDTERPLATTEPTLFPPPTTSSMTAKLKSALGVNNKSRAEDKYSPLLGFLQDNDICLTRPHGDFCVWLESVQIFNIEELAEALDDDDFCRLEMKANGLKYFKRFALRKAIDEFLAVAPSATHSTTPSELSVMDSVDPPFELVCPIRHALMVNDPVIAPDGFTYEREAIVEWCERAEGDHTEKALSPMTHEPLGDAPLVSNAAIRIMARDWSTKVKPHAEHS